MTETAGEGGAARGRVALFATCLVDLFRPSVGHAAVALLREAGYEVAVPRGQTCCGQPNYNGGHRAGAIAAARQTISVLEGFDHVVVPSGSCAGMIKVHFPRLLAEEGAWAGRATALAARTHELLAFLHDVAGWCPKSRERRETLTYHDSCSGLRELGVKAQPRALLGRLAGLTLKEMIDPELCCGFGGTFAVKYPEISAKMTADKVADIAHSGAELVACGDTGCLMNIEGKLRREGRATRAYHAAELLAGIEPSED